jgi:UDP-hydrolysing UDP-N-acetyl-D-glucosamine 2-epimerase
MRHAITKLAHVHFAATQKSAERIIRMGEPPEHVHVVGAPGLDEALAGPFFECDELGRKLGGDLSRAPVVVVQHSVSTRPEDAAGEITETMEAVRRTGRPAIAIYPNNDAGGAAVIETIRGYETRKIVTAFASLPRTEFLSLLRCAGALVGNSSSGIIEAASFKLPVVSVGERQLGREHAENVIDVPDARRENIREALDRALSPEFRAGLANLANPYGDGHASERIVRALEELKIDHRLIQKQFVD